jgi:hypothetical protein
MIRIGLPCAQAGALSASDAAPNWRRVIEFMGVLLAEGGGVFTSLNANGHQDQALALSASEVNESA